MLVSLSASPRFSVVIPTYQRRNTIERAIRSVLLQTFTDFELIILDDGSTDGSGELVRKLDDPRVRYIWQANAGRSAARNRGAGLARGELLTFLDSDDEVVPDWLSSFASALDQPDTQVACCGARILLDDQRLGRRREEFRLPRRLGPVYDEVVGLFLAGTFALRRDLFQELGGYETTLSFSENTELALRLVPRCTTRGLRIGSVARALVLVHSQRTSETEQTLLNRLASAEFMLRRHGDRYFQRSRRGYANYRAIAGVCAARLGRNRDATRHLAAALAAAPWRGAHWARLMLSLASPLARRYWSRYPGPAKE